MATTMTLPLGTRSKLPSVTRPVRARRVSITIKPSTKEQTKLRRDRISAIVSVLFILGMVVLVIWAAVAGGTAGFGVMRDVPYLY